MNTHFISVFPFLLVALIGYSQDKVVQKWYKTNGGSLSGADLHGDEGVHLHTLKLHKHHYIFCILTTSNVLFAPQTQKAQPIFTHSFSHYILFSKPKVSQSKNQTYIIIARQQKPLRRSRHHSVVTTIRTPLASLSLRGSPLFFLPSQMLTKHGNNKNSTKVLEDTSTRALENETETHAKILMSQSNLQKCNNNAKIKILIL